jgi:hypothetical protein
VPEPLPFEYRTRQKNIPWERPDEARRVNEQRDRELEDFLATLGTGSTTPGTTFYSGILAAGSVDPAGFDVIVPFDAVIDSYGGVFTYSAGTPNVLRVTQDCRIRYNYDIIVGDNAASPGPGGGEPISVTAILKDSGGSTILLSSASVPDPGVVTVNGYHLTGAVGPVTVDAGSTLEFHVFSSTTGYATSVVGMEWASPTTGG